MRNGRKLRALFLLGWTSLSIFAIAFSKETVLGSRTPQAESSQQTLESPQTPDAKSPEKIVPAFKNIKEQTATYVFLGWIWVSIFVLIYILWNKIKELDRLFQAKFFDSHHPPDA